LLVNGTAVLIGFGGFKGYGLAANGTRSQRRRVVHRRSLQAEECSQLEHERKEFLSLEISAEIEKKVLQKIP
jgi:hypothetical protein